MFKNVKKTMTEDLEHSVLTEILIVVSQTVFFILLFMSLKYGIIDRYGWMDSKEQIQKNLLPIVAIYFAILTILSVIMIPLQYYEYGHVVLITTIISIFVIFAYEFQRVYYSNHSDNKSNSAIKAVSKNIFIRNNVAAAKKELTTPRKSQAEPSDDFDF